jgi:hypothetical protein
MLVAGCTEKYTYRYRVTVEVDTPQGLRSGSSVWETTAWEGSGIPDTAIRSQEKGEAVALNLPGGTLFALLRDPKLGYDYAKGIVEGHLDRHPLPDVPMGKDWKESRRLIAKAKPAFELAPDEYPLLVRFGDTSNSASIEQVSPTDLAAQFGQGIRLRRITVAVTDEEPVIGPIRHRLPWLSDDQNSDRRTKGDHPPYDRSLPAKVRHGPTINRFAGDMSPIQALGVYPPQWISIGIDIQIAPALNPDGIGLDVAAGG